MIICKKHSECPNSWMYWCRPPECFDPELSPPPADLLAQLDKAKRDLAIQTNLCDGYRVKWGIVRRDLETLERERDAAIEALREAMGTIAGIFAPSKLSTQWQRWTEIVNRKGKT